MGTLLLVGNLVLTVIFGLVIVIIIKDRAEEHMIATKVKNYTKSNKGEQAF